MKTDMATLQLLMAENRSAIKSIRDELFDEIELLQAVLSCIQLHQLVFSQNKL